MAAHDEKSPYSYTIRFAPEQIMQEAEENLKKSFRTTLDTQLKEFLSEKAEWPYPKDRPPRKIPGAGLLLIQDFLQKKFDDPETINRMEAFYEANFDRIMGEAMEKALQHKANGFVFGRSKDKAAA